MQTKKENPEALHQKRNCILPHPDPPAPDPPALATGHGPPADEAVPPPPLLPATQLGKALPVEMPALEWVNPLALPTQIISSVSQSLLMSLGGFLPQSVPIHENPAYFMAWVPVYDTQGSVTRILYLNGSHESQRREVRTLLRRTCAHFGKDPHLVRKSSGLGSSAPFPLERTALVGMRMRDPICPRDNTLGYVNLCYVRGICTHPEIPSQTLLHFCNGETLTILWNFKTIRKRLEQGTVAVTRSLLKEV